MDRRDFFRGVFASAALAITSNYGRLASTSELELEPVAAEPSFAYHESSPTFTEWTRREGAGVNLPYGVVRPSEVVIEYERAVETVLTFDDQAAYGGAAGGGLKFEHGIRREFIEALESTRKHQHITDKAKVLTFNGIRRAFLKLVGGGA